MQLRLAAAVTGLILLVLFTFLWRPPQAAPQITAAPDAVDDTPPELLIAPPPEDLLAPGSIRRSDRLVQQATGSTLSPNVEIPPPAFPLPDAGSATRPKRLPLPARAPIARPPRIPEAGSMIRGAPVPALPAFPAVPEAGSVARKPGGRPAAPRIAILGGVTVIPKLDPATTTLARFIALSPGSLQIAVGDTNGDIRLLDVATRSLIRTIKPQSASPLELLYTPDGSLLFSATDRQLSLYDTATGEIARRYSPPETLHAMALLPGGEHLCATTDGGRLIKLSLTSGDVIELGARTEPAGRTALAFATSANGLYAATGHSNGITHVWRVDHPGPPQSVPGGGSVRCLAFSPDGRRLAVATSDNRIRIWTRDPQGEFVLERTVSAVPQATGLQFGSDSRQLFITRQAGLSSSLFRIDSHTRASTHLTDANSKSIVRDFTISPDGLTLAVLLSDRTVELFTLDPATSAVQNQTTITAARNP